METSIIHSSSLILFSFLPPGVEFSMWFHICLLFRDWSISYSPAVYIRNSTNLISKSYHTVLLWVSDHANIHPTFHQADQSRPFGETEKVICRMLLIIQVLFHFCSSSVDQIELVRHDRVIVFFLFHTSLESQNLEWVNTVC